MPSDEVTERRSDGVTEGKGKPRSHGEGTEARGQPRSHGGEGGAGCQRARLLLGMVGRERVTGNGERVGWWGVVEFGERLVEFKSQTMGFGVAGSANSRRWFVSVAGGWLFARLGQARA